MTTLELYRVLQETTGRLNELAVRLLEGQNTINTTKDAARQVIEPLAEKLDIELH